MSWEDAFFRIHADLPREGPGDRASLDRAMAAAAPPRDARILDAGCGPGADVAGLLAAAPEGHVTAIDTHEPFVGRVRAAFAGEPRVTAEVRDMADPGGPFDLIWSAGALYFLGVEQGLRRWADVLAPNGRIAFSELVRLVPEPHPDAAAFWLTEYPQMTDMAGVRAAVGRAGFEVLDAFVLPEAAWEAYYAPIEARLEALEAADPDHDMVDAIERQRAEIDHSRRFRDQIGYGVFVVARA